jgi:membrane protease YdiL (CAAX protease family)
VDVLSLVAILGMTVVSHRLHRDTAGRMGFRLDNLRPAARAAATPTLIMALVLVGTGLAFGSVRLPYRQLVIGLTLYPIWGLVQQYALQGMVLLRLEDAGIRGRSASVAAAALFALVHIPNPGLMVMVFVAGWVWCDLFRRRANLFVLAVSHGWLATLAALVLPTLVTGELRIGPDYLAHFVHGAAR